MDEVSTKLKKNAGIFTEAFGVLHVCDISF